MTVNTIGIDLTKVVDVTQSRESTPLVGLGYGVIKPLGKKTPALFHLALNEKERFCSLVEEHDRELLALANSIRAHGQKQNCGVNECKDGLIVTWGTRRILAVLYNHAKHGTPPTVWATMGKGNKKQALIDSVLENFHRKQGSMIDEAKLFQKLKTHGLSATKIAALCPVLGDKDPEQTISNRLKLLKCSQQVQTAVHAGQMSQKAALQTLEPQRQKGAGRPLNTQRVLAVWLEKAKNLELTDDVTTRLAQELHDLLGELLGKKEAT
jgi:ParB-like chromosome segregation protein Spo0J